jgi:hypothetical protein
MLSIETRDDIKTHAPVIAVINRIINNGDTFNNILNFLTKNTNELKALGKVKNDNTISRLRQFIVTHKNFNPVQKNILKLNIESFE